MARILMLLAMLVTGTASSQLPEFSQQYRQRLGGAIDALEEVLADFYRDADAFGMTSAEAIALQKASDDPFIRARGDSMLNAEIRLSRLKQQQAELQTAGSIRRLVIFAQGFDPQLAQATADDYEPAVPVTGEGIASAGAGAIAGLFIMWFLVGAARITKRRVLRRPSRP
ncbi:DUF2937 family protein [Rhodobacterales bacterium]|nr:DUF2937 family protein [Rhodobacterales bacterium]